MTEPPKWTRMTVGELLEKLDIEGNVIGLMNTDGEVRAFVIRASPMINDLVMQLTGRLPPAPESR